MPSGPGGLDGNGIWQFGEDDAVGSLFSDFLNLLAGSTSAEIGDLVTALGVVQGKLADTGWITPALNAGWTALGGEAPGYRRLNGVTIFRGRGTSTGASQYAFALPANFRPSFNTISRTDANGTSVRALVSSGGGVGQVAAAAVTAYSFGGLPSFIAEL